MKNFFTFAKNSYLPSLAIGLAIGLVLPLPVFAATVTLATSPLASSTTTAVKPNVLFVLDDSGSMDWDHMPDVDTDNGSSVTWKFGDYGLRSSQCNQVYYNPNTTYAPPVNDALPPVSYPNASFANAWVDGFNTGSGTKNLNSQFRAASTSFGGDTVDTAAYYFTYSGSQTTQLLKDYNSITNTFFNECSSANGVPPGSGVFTKVTLSPRASTITISSSGSTSVSGITVNGSQIMSASVAASTTQSTLATNIAGKINACSSAISGACAVSGYTATASGSVVTILGPFAANTYTPVVTKSGTMSFTMTAFPTVAADTATSIHDPVKLQNFANWYSYYRTRMLMMKTAAGQAFSTLTDKYRVGLLRLSSSNAPAVELGAFDTTKRTEWYNAFYGITPGGGTPLRVALSDAGRYYAGLLGSATDPMQYSCQQNFSILSTDGYWNGGAGYKLDGSTAVGNQDDLLARPYYDGATVLTTYTYTYTRDFYSKTSSGCSGGNKRIKTQPQIGTCTLSTGTSSCTPASWSNNGSSTNSGTCDGNAAPSPSALVFVDVNQNTSGGSSDSLADVASYYYQTDLRTPGLSNCTGAISGELLCATPVAPQIEDPYNNVFKSNTDKNAQQHMTTFTLGLGASGRMNYIPGYAKDGTSTDYDAIRLGTTAHPAATPPVCKWQADGSTCNWPVPGSVSGGDGKIENIDDLWHAAVNGHGTYFSATDPDTLSSGLSNALASINAKKGAAAAAATSTLNPVAGNNFAFVASYTTVEWTGNLEARGINTDTGEVSENATWCVESIPNPGSCTTTPVLQTSGDTTVYNCETPSPGTCADGGPGDFSGDSTTGPLVCKTPVAVACTGTMNAKVAAASDTRVIKTANDAGTALINFDATYAAAHTSYFNTARINTLGQWASLDSPQQTAAANGTNLINYLRGQSGFEDRSTNVSGTTDNRLFRVRSAVLGDALESQPAFLGKPVFSYPYPGYTEFKTANSGRSGTVYMGTNDGMMHAIVSGTGAERWAYVPSMVIPNMWKLADFNYSSGHSNFVNGSPITSDICASAVANCNNTNFASTVTTADDPVWKTILVAGLNGGGRGYYAMDITDPANPTLLWEFTTTAGIGKTQDDDLGYSYGQPVITKKADGTWVVLVTSGYNNVSPGDGKGYIYVLNANTGAIISKISTGVGTTTTPSGLAKIAAWNEEPPGNLTKYVYGGDLSGNVWRFDISSSTTAAIGTGDKFKFATLFSDSTTVGVAGSNPQSIMTTPVLGKVTGNRVVFVGTGKYLETSDLSTTQRQTQYAIRDDNSNVTFVNPRSYSSPTMVQQTITTNTAAGTRSITAATTAPNFATGRGWFADLPESGERVNIDSQLVQGVLLVPSIVPSNTACSPGGHGWLNFFDFKTGAAVTSSNIVSARYDATIVGVNVFYIDGEPVVGVVTSDNPTPKKDDDVTFPPTAGNFSGKRTLWRELTQ